ncbi:Uncharacterized protein GBIM_17902 [Gryllus bimaculatus]|nr:Uncharacterized protein GBIM_17902 [Gryllus bimaculatus]
MLPPFPRESSPARTSTCAAGGRMVQQLALRPLGALMALVVATAACSNAASAYPVFGTKRYGRGTAPRLPPRRRRRHRRGRGSPPASVPAPMLAVFSAARADPTRRMAFPRLPQLLQSADSILDEIPDTIKEPFLGSLGVKKLNNYITEPVMTYPYPREYADSPDYYYGEPTFASYPYYYPSSSKYAPVYHHSLMPYYYGSAQQRPYAAYGYEEPNDPVDDLEEEIQLEEEREEREEALPIGQETWFENSSPHQSTQLQQQQQQQDMADVNAIFLQNLILSQMYNDAIARGVHPMYQAPDPRYAYGYAMQEEDPAEQEGWVYGDIRAHADPDYYRSDRDSEDEDVRALKSLVKKDQTSKFLNTLKPVAAEGYDTELPLEGGSWVKPDEQEDRADDYADEYRQARPLDKKQPEYGEWVPQKDITLNFSDRKSTGFQRVAKNDASVWANQLPAAEDETTSTTTTTTTTTTTAAPLTPTAPTEQPAFDRKKGMKEVALPRPATPVRHRAPPPPPLALPAFVPAAHSQKPRHAQSVYETIKQLINMQEKLRGKDERPFDDEADAAGAAAAAESNIHPNLYPRERVLERILMQKRSNTEEMQPRQFKRFVSNEEALVEELSGLKKMSA